MNRSTRLAANDLGAAPSLVAGLAPVAPLAILSALVWLAPPAQSFFALNAAFVWAGLVLAFLAGRASQSATRRLAQFGAPLLMMLGFGAVIATIWDYPRLSLGLAALGFASAFAASWGRRGTSVILTPPAFLLTLLALAVLAVTVFGGPGL